MPAIAGIVATPEPVCVERQRLRPANRAVPADTVLIQHKAMLLTATAVEKLQQVVFADNLYQPLRTWSG